MPEHQCRNTHLTSHKPPLNNSFLVFYTAVVRLLLKYGADSDFKTGRAWTSVPFLWDSPHRPYANTGEILEICIDQ